LDSFSTVVSENLKLLEIIFPDNAFQRSINFGCQEISFPETWGFLEKFHSDPKSEGRDISE